MESHHIRCAGSPCVCAFIVEREAEIERYWKQSRVAVLIFLVEIIGGLLSHGFSVISDSLHVFVDFAFYLTGVKVAKDELRALAPQPHSRQIGAYSHGFVFFPVATLIAFHAIERLQGEQGIAPTPLIYSTILGLLGNIWQVKIAGKVHNITEKGVWFHNITDCLASAVALIAGLAIFFGVTSAVDGWASLGIAVIMFWSGATIIYQARNGHHH